MSDEENRFQNSLENAGLLVAQIRILMMDKEVHKRVLQHVLQTNGVQCLEALDTVTLKNLLHHLQSL